jgi:hypothetical protein
LSHDLLIPITREIYNVEIAHLMTSKTSLQGAEIDFK